MNIKKFLNKWYDKEITDWGGQTQPEYKHLRTDYEYSDFQRNYKSVIKEFCKDIGMELHSFNKNHYNFSAVIKSNATNQFYYVSISDVRYWKNEWADNILYRTMEHEKDWTGGSNRYSKLQDLPESLLNLDIQISQKLEREQTRQITQKVEIQNKETYDLDVNYA